MLSVFIFTHNSEKQLAHTLQALVPAVVDGLLRRVVVVDQGSTDNTRLAAEGAGCAFYAAGELSQALDGLRTEWLLLLQPGATLADGWEDAVRRHAETSSAPARFSLPGEGRFGMLGKLFARSPSLEAGLLFKIEKLGSLPQNAAEFQNWLRMLKSVRLPQIITPPETTKGGA